MVTIRPGVLWLLLALVTLGVFGAMRVWTMPVIHAGSGGLAILDLRMAGYGEAEVRAFLAALSPEARATYLGPQRALDTVLPMALGATMGLGGFLLMWPWSRPIAVVITFVPLVYFACDMIENAHVAALLSRATVDTNLIQAASRWTVWKGEALRASVAVLLIVMALRALVFVFAGGRKAG